ncbi:hypothetical protein AB0J72_14715 [Dactylosporangium sp. NPDC049742]|uniref:hypothetical protein n=1 Tax=Dactylosporangium sp. NPDC049742 TaxID=3154737 RepID=UPI003423E282
MFGIDMGGWVWVHRLGDGTLALTEVAYATGDSDDAPADDPAFGGFVAGPPDPAAVDAGVVDCPSGALAILPAPASGEAVPGVLAIGGGEFSGGAETGLVVTGVPARLRLWIEEPVEAAWGRAARALLVREP